MKLGTKEAFAKPTLLLLITPQKHGGSPVVYREHGGLPVQNETFVQFEPKCVAAMYECAGTILGARFSANEMDITSMNFSLKHYFDPGEQHSNPGITTLMSDGSWSCHNISVEDADSGYDAASDDGWSSLSSSSSSIHETEDLYDPWRERVVHASRKHESRGIYPAFNIWTPCEDDDDLLDKATIRVGCDAWGPFASWSPVPTPQEAEEMRAHALALEAAAKAEAHLRKALKKAKQRKFRRF